MLYLPHSTLNFYFCNENVNVFIISNDSISVACTFHVHKKLTIFIFLATSMHVKVTCTSRHRYANVFPTCKTHQTERADHRKPNQTSPSSPPDPNSPGKKMGQADADPTPDQQPETAALLHPPRKVPDDAFHFAYLIFFTLGLGFLLPWNVFITAVDYFSYLYPSANVDSVFAVVYMLVALFSLIAILFFLSRRSASSGDAFIRINLGLALFVAALLVVPVMDVAYVKGRRGLYDGFDVTVAAVALCGLADALVQGGIIGSAGEMPERYMQAVVAGTAASGVLISLLRVVTKAAYPQDAQGLRKSANLYFSVSIVIMALCMVFYNIADRLPVIKYYKELKVQAVNEDKEEKGEAAWRTSLWSVVGRIKWYGLGIVLIYVVTLSIFPGYITEDVHSELLKDWYAIILITAYNIFDLIGKSLTAHYLLENAKVAIWSCVVRLLFFPLFYVCLHGPSFLRTEIPVTILTCLLGLTNGYLTSVLMILAPKVVELQHAETAGIVVVLFLIVGLAIGSVVAWFWVI